MLTRCVVVFFIVSFYESVLAIPENYWEGNWFPGDPGTVDTNDAVDEIQMKQLVNENKDGHPDLTDDKHGIKMGISDPDCDDSEKNITIDWNGSALDYTCFHPRFKPNYNVHPLTKCDHIPDDYYAYHLCMNTTIHYQNKIPTFGNHRPLWAKYGEFKYVPRQRWLHNLEHGAIVMLYHPCANPKEVAKLKKIVRNCMWKHVIAALTDLTEERPMVLVSWGCRLFMNVVNEKLVTKFIKKHAMKGPEEMYGQGFYTKGLIKLAKILTDKNDTVICPNSHF